MEKRLLNDQQVGVFRVKLKNYCYQYLGANVKIN